MNIIQCNAHTIDSDDKIKEALYDQLQSVIQKYTERAIFVLMGDLNAKVGSHKTGYETRKPTNWWGSTKGDETCGLLSTVVFDTIEISHLYNA